jgi:transposase
VFLDESGAKTDMTRRYGRAARGERVIEAVPGGHWNTTTLIHAIDVEGTRAAMITDGPTNAAVFEGFVRWLLVPALHAGDIVVMDNLSSHKTAAVAEAIEAVGATICYLPPYSPDMNPIEKIFSKIKAWLRSAQARTEATLYDAIADALRSITPTDCRNCFRAAGYRAA